MAKYKILVSVHQGVVYEVEADSPEQARQYQVGDKGVEEVSRKTLDAFICDVEEID